MRHGAGFRRRHFLGAAAIVALAGSGSSYAPDNEANLESVGSVDLSLLGLPAS